MSTLISRASSHSSPTTRLLLDLNQSMPRVLFFYSHHCVNRLLCRVVQTMLDESVGLFVHLVEIEVGASRFSEQEAVQKGNRNIAIGSALTHDVPALVLIDGATAGVLRTDGRQHRETSQDGTHDDVELRSHHCPPRQLQLV